MTVLEEQHTAHGATFREVGGIRVVDDYGRPERTIRAVRHGVGVIERPLGVVEVTGADRVDFVDNAVTNRVPTAEDQGCYALLLDPQGRIETDMYVFTTPDRILIFTPPDQATPLASTWSEKTFIQDVELAVRTESVTIFGVHGPTATEKVASILHGASPPADPLTIDRGSIAEVGISLIADEGVVGEEGYMVVCSAEEAATVFDALLTLGMNAVPFGQRSWEVLTLEAGTPLFDSELRDRIPNSVGVRNALDFEKGCYVGQEVVSRIENRGSPPHRLVGLLPERAPEPGTDVRSGDDSIGTVTRSASSPIRDEPIAFALVSEESTALTVQLENEFVEAARTELPFVEGSARSARLPTYQ